MIENIKNTFNESIETIEASLDLVEKIDYTISIISKCFKNKNKLIIFGNGGSAADAQHIAAEFIGRFRHERESLPAIALTTDTSTLSSIGNDYSFDIIFSRQCESIVKKGDVVIGISTSGNSKNVGAITIGLLGNEGGKIKDLVEIPLIVNSSSTARIQEVHRIIYHIICEQVEHQFIK